MFNFVQNLNKAFENRIRLGVMSILMVNETVSYNKLKDLLKATDGNLASHLKSLEKLEYIMVEKQFVNRKPLTTYKATSLGKEAFKRHLNALEKMLKGE